VVVHALVLVARWWFAVVLAMRLALAAAAAL
jgi:hypothetical protein